MTLIDHILVVTLVAFAVSALVWRLAFSSRPPACAPKTTAPEVTVSPALERALERAAKKRRAQSSTSKTLASTTKTARAVQ
jgi:hypothetical protein